MLLLCKNETLRFYFRHCRQAPNRYLQLKKTMDIKRNLYILKILKESFGENLTDPVIKSSISFSNYWTEFEEMISQHKIQTNPDIKRLAQARGVDLFQKTRIFSFLNIIFFISGIIFLFFRNYIKNNKINYEKNILKIKIIGKIYREIKILDFSQNMHSLLCSKIELIQALELCFKNTEGFFKKELEKIVVKLKKGKEITKSFGNSAFFDREYISFLNIGEKTGDMETAFSNLTEIYYDRVNEKIKLFLKILEPVSIIIIGIIIGFIVFSVMMPIFKMSEGL